MYGQTNLHVGRAALARELMAAWHRKVRLGPHHAVKGRTRPGRVESRAGIVRAACARFAGNREIPSFVGRWSRLPRRRHPTSPSAGRLLLRAGCSRLERAAALRPYRTRHRPCRHLRHRPPRRHPPSSSAGRLLLRAGCSRLERAAALRPYRTRHRPCRHLRHRRPPRRHPPSPSAQ
jgi:hypothetical protein